MAHSRSTILLVDDQITNLTIGKNMLKTFYQVIPVASASGMFETLGQIEPDLILLDVDMPDMNGYDAIRALKADARYAEIPVVFLTAKDDADSELEGLDLGAADYIRKPFFAPTLLKRISRELQIVNQKKELLSAREGYRENLAIVESQVREKAVEVFRLQNAILTNVADLVELRDEHTGGHIIRTQLYIQAMIEEMIRRGIYDDEIGAWNIDEVVSSAKLHDVGKISTPDSILNKPGKLTPEEYEVMKGHVLTGVDAIEKIMKNTYENNYMQHALNVIGTHHEKWDGSGYPMRLRGRNIPLEGRLMAVADVYDALISVRQYKRAFSHEDSRRIIEESAGAQFDPALIDAFRGIEGEFEEIALAHENA